MPGGRAPQLCAEVTPARIITKDDACGMWQESPAMQCLVLVRRRGKGKLLGTSDSYRGAHTLMPTSAHHSSAQQAAFGGGRSKALQQLGGRVHRCFRCTPGLCIGLFQAQEEIQSAPCADSAALPVSACFVSDPKQERGPSSLPSLLPHHF